MLRFLKFLLGTSPSAQDLYSPVAAIRFTLLASLLYAGLMLPAFDLQRDFAGAFRAYGNFLFADQFLSHEDASVHFFDAGADDLFQQVDAAIPAIDLPPAIAPRIPRTQGEKDTLLLLQKGEAGTIGFLRTGARLMAFTPTAILLAIVVATPVSLRRRVVLTLCSFALLAAFIAFRLTILVLHGGFAAPGKAYRLYEPSDFWRDILSRADKIFCDNPTFHYVAPVIIWAVVSIVLSVIAHTIRNRRTAGETPADPTD